jgi:rhamnogalacturonan endolyase
MKFRRMTLASSAAVVSVAALFSGCGSDGENSPPNPYAPGGGTPNPSDGLPQAGAGGSPTGIPDGANTEGNPDGLALAGSGPVGPSSPTDTPSQPPGPPLSSGPGFAAVENLDRGVVAVQEDGGIYVGWRMFGYEYDREAPERITYNVYRDGVSIASVADSTNLFDPAGNEASAYAVSVVIDGVEGLLSPAVTPWAQNFLRVPLEPPGPSYIAHDSSLGDVDGDGRYEIFLLWQPEDAKDNSQAGVTSNVFIDALKVDGTRLWRVDLGPNLRAGEHYNQYVVIDADGDGRAELGIKTAPGTRDGTGQFLSVGPAAGDDDSAVFRNADGYILSGPEYLTVFEGLTGRELDTAEYIVPRGAVNAWGDNYGNRVDRFLAAAAYVDESGLPSFVMARGYYTRSTLGAWSFRDGKLALEWLFDSDETPRDASGQPFTGQGTHSLSVANVDADPEQEIIYGEMTIDHDGTGKCSTGIGHGDALHVSDFILDRPGLEAFKPAEDTSKPFYTLHDPNDCSILQQSDQTGTDVGRGVAADVVANNPGAEFWAAAGVGLTSATTGQLLGGPQPSSINFLIWWDADELRELENGTSISKVGTNGALLTCGACSANNGSKSVPNLVADLIGDWREEVIWRETDNSALRIYTTTDVTARRIYTLMHDPQYRSAISWQNVGYNQPPHPSFHIGADMAAPPTPDIHAIPRPATTPL